MAKQPVNNEKYNNGAEATSAQFFGAIPRNKGSYKFIHIAN